MLGGLVYCYSEHSKDPASNVNSVNTVTDYRPGESSCNKQITTNVLCDYLCANSLAFPMQVLWALLVIFPNREVCISSVLLEGRNLAGRNVRTTIQEHCLATIVAVVQSSSRTREDAKDTDKSAPVHNPATPLADALHQAHEGRSSPMECLPLQQA